VAPGGGLGEAGRCGVGRDLLVEPDAGEVVGVGRVGQAPDGDGAAGRGQLDLGAGGF
jgi:hypothetical protein